MAKRIIIALLLVSCVVSAQAQGISGSPKFSFASPSMSKVFITNGPGDPFGSGAPLRWPDKKVMLDVNDATLARVMIQIGQTTGIRFTLARGVPKDLKLTLHTGGMRVRQFLDMLSDATGLVYRAESKTPSAAEPRINGLSGGSSARTSPNPAELRKKMADLKAQYEAARTEHPGENAVEFSLGLQQKVMEAFQKALESGSLNFPPGQDQSFPQAGLVPQLYGFDSKNGDAATGFAGVLLNTIGRRVTDVTIFNPRAGDLVVNQGKVSVFFKDVDAIEAATSIIDRIEGASYIVMNLDSYLSLQDPDRAVVVRKALHSLREGDLIAPARARVTLDFRNVEIAAALTQLAEKGQFYITTPNPGVSSYLIIPDVVVTDKKALPGL